MSIYCTSYTENGQVIKPDLYHHKYSVPRLDIKNKGCYITFIKGVDGDTESTFQSERAAVMAESGSGKGFHTVTAPEPAG